MTESKRISSLEGQCDFFKMSAVNHDQRIESLENQLDMLAKAVLPNVELSNDWGSGVRVLRNVSKDESRTVYVKPRLEPTRIVIEAFERPSRLELMLGNEEFVLSLQDAYALAHMLQTNADKVKPKDYKDD